LTLKHDRLLSSSAFNFNLRRYKLKELVGMVKAGALKMPVDSVVGFKAGPIMSAYIDTSLTVSQSCQHIPPHH